MVVFHLKTCSSGNKISLAQTTTALNPLCAYKRKQTWCKVLGLNGMIVNVFSGQTSEDLG